KPFSTIACPCYHLRAAVDADHRMAFLGELNRVPPCTTTQIQNGAGSREVLLNQPVHVIGFGRVVFALIEIVVEIGGSFEGVQHMISCTAATTRSICPSLSATPLGR